MIRSVIVGLVAAILTAAPAVAQTPKPTGPSSVPKAPAPWTYYMAMATIGIAGLTLIMAVLGYLVQAPGFRRGQRSGQAS